MQTEYEREGFARHCLRKSPPPSIYYCFCVIDLYNTCIIIWCILKYVLKHYTLECVMNEIISNLLRLSILQRQAPLHPQPRSSSAATHTTSTSPATTPWNAAAAVEIPTTTRVRTGHLGSFTDFMKISCVVDTKLL